ncbi:MAG: hypothetical protein FD189_313 [Elusimicrobia bacterium]|nr:MAG: hypothetical protein FD154_113 [Elusimicrobiota bacterium]KAF0158046.1 MAG: hypothetical protein FD189_313 [Elusimicrobiota bacterium]
MIYLNGRPAAARGGATVREILKAAGLAPALTVVTLDGVFVPPADYRKLRPGDGARLEAREMREGG